MTRAQIETRYFMAFACIECGADVHTENAPDLKKQGQTVVWRGVPCSGCGMTYRCTVSR